MRHESASEAWALRYGTEAPAIDPGLTPFLRHRSVRDFAPHPVAEDSVRGLFAAAQSAATSSNLQLWSAVSVQDPARRDALAKLAGDQRQVRECGWFFVFLADIFRLGQASRAAGVDPAGLEYAEFTTMAVIDASLAAERMVCAAEAIGLGICYIGALRNDPEGVARILKLPHGTFGLFGLCLGHPAAACAAEIKPRLGQPAVWFREEYSPAPDVSEYDGRMKAFYLAQGMKGDFSWSARSGRRADGSEKQMGGRAGQKAWLDARGFSRK